MTDCEFSKQYLKCWLAGLTFVDDFLNDLENTSDFKEDNKSEHSKDDLAIHKERYKKYTIYLWPMNQWYMDKLKIMIICNAMQTSKKTSKILQITPMLTCCYDTNV